MRTPLAWKNLTCSWSKCALAATGVGFAVALMFMQIGFQRALIDNNVRILSLIDPDHAQLAVVSRARYNLSTEQRFTRQVLERVASYPVVKQVCKFTLERGTARVKVEGKSAKPIRVVAVELSDPSFFADPQLYEKLLQADRRRAALLDVRSKPLYGFADSVDKLQKQWIELNDKALPVFDQFSLGTDFGSDGTLMMSDTVHASYFPFRNPSGRPADVVDIGLLHVESDNLESLAAEIQQLAPRQILVRPTARLIEEEKRFWERQTPVGRIFLIGTIMGLVVGAIICYQIQFTDITDHMPEFATLKAMGYSAAYFWSLILWQSFYLACLGFLPGMLAALFLYSVLSAYSGLIMEMTALRIAAVFGLTLLMCIISGALAIRKLFRADPASLF